MTFQRLSLLLLSCTVLPTATLGQGQTNVPTKLFDVELGGIYEIGDGGNDLGTMPVSKATGTQSAFLQPGIHYYFKPLKEYPAFEYIEYPEDDSEFFRTSYLLNLLPVIPDSVERTEDLETQVISYEVTGILWQLSENNNESGNYSWAMNLCKSFSVDLGIEPSVSSHSTLGPFMYECKFSDEERELTVTSWPFRILKLSYLTDIFESKNEAFEAKLRMLQMEDIRPYQLP